MDEAKLFSKLDSIEKALNLSKKVLSFDEVCSYMHISPSHLYKMTSACIIPHYKPTGKRIFFDREELEKWLLTNRVATIEEIDEKANEYLMKHKMKW